MTNNDTAFYAFFQKLNGKVYTDPEQMRVDFNEALDESGLTVTKKDKEKVTKKETKKVTKKLTFNKKDSKKKKK